jgi:hypothetical protein
MFKVFTTDKSSYDAISYPTDYLYTQYDKIISFLNQNYAGKYNNILAKPIIDGSFVNWYANSNKKYDRISKLPNEIQNQIKSKYLENLKDFNLSIERFRQSNKIEERNWGELLSKVFNDDNNIILSDGEDFILLWGWKFRNTPEIYIPPIFSPKNEPSVETNKNTEPVIFDSGDLVPEINQPSPPPPIIIVADNRDKEFSNNPIATGKSNFGHRLKRYFRNFTYRYWALMLLIILIFLLLCLCKSCNNSNAQLNELNKKLEKAENKVKNNCP